MTRKTIITITVVVVVILLAVTAMKIFDIKLFDKKNKSEKDNFIKKTMEIQEVTKGNVSNAISSSGKASLNETVTMHLPINMKIDNVEVKSGAMIKKGDVIAGLDVKALKNEHDDIMAQLNKAKIELGKMEGYTNIRIIADQMGIVTNNILSNYEYEKILETQKKITITQNNKEVKVHRDYIPVIKKVADLLNENKIVLAIENENYSTTIGENLPDGEISRIYKKAKSGSKVKPGDVLFIIKTENKDMKTQINSIEELEQKLDTVNALINSPQIQATYSGIIDEVTIKEGSMHEANQDIIKIKLQDNVTVNISIIEKEMRQLEIGQHANVKFGEAIMEAEVLHINYNANDEGKFNIELKVVKIDDSENDILPNTKATVNILLEEKQDVLKVSVDAIKTDSKGEYVLVYTGNPEDLTTYTVDTIPAEKRYIKKGLVTPLYAEITEGVFEGEKIVVVNVSKNDNQDFYSSMIGF
ncbi:MAG: biotin/lipoyl-binding protein [Clostridiales bacterium]|nr:biotin/lipoyl-binding protein [Clostridiales bacterium]